jgi:hypothetical protein
MRKPRIILGLTGSPDSSRAPEILAKLRKFADVAVVLTDRAQHFVDCQELEKACGPCTVPNSVARKFNYFTDSDEWNWSRTEKDGTPYYSAKWQPGDLILHEQLDIWANLIVIAPADPDVMARLDIGLANDLLTLAVSRSSGWRPCILAPSLWPYGMTEIKRFIYVHEELGGGMSETERIVEVVKSTLPKGMNEDDNTGAGRGKKSLGAGGRRNPRTRKKSRLRQR